MLRFFSKRLCSVVLENKTVLKGELNPMKKGCLLSGTAILPDGRVFSGEFDREGGFPLDGSQLEEDGDLYRGAFNNQWQRHGAGEAWLADGTYYKGLFADDELVKGTVRIPNGTSEICFSGTLKDESFVKGKLTEPDFVYEGTFSDNQPHGKGCLTFTSGASQEGTFFNGKLHGSNCKMKLEGGFVYCGDFVNGQVVRGTLYTPTYTYEGEFNEHGRAHGEGSQTYLVNEPRLTFTGVWNNGALVRGQCIDEYGNPVDWQDNHELQRSVLGSDEQVAVNSYCSSKLKEADTLHRDLNQSYVHDAETVAKSTGHYPTKMDLGYEGSIAAENAAVSSANRKQMEDLEESKESFAQQPKQFDDVVSNLQHSVIGEINENMAKIQFSRQMGAQELSSQRMDEQFDRFMKSFSRGSGDGDKATGGEAEKESNEEDENGALYIDGNAPWKSFTSSK